MFRYAFCYVPKRGYWVDGFGSHALFTQDIQGASLFVMDSPTLAKSVELLGGEVEEVTCTTQMQARVY